MTDVTAIGGTDAASLTVRRPAWVAHVLDDASGEPRAVLLHLPRGERTALSGTGTRVWQLIVAGGDVGTSAAAMAPVLADVFGADPQVVQADVATLVEQLLAGGWAEPTTREPGQG